MEQLKKEIKTYLHVEEYDKENDIYIGTKSWDYGGPRGMFGGQVAAQTMAAAMLSVEPEYHIHSMHLHFLLGGKREEPIYFHVERTRDGRSFASRTVNAKQDGKIIYTMICSFQKPEDSPTTHQYSMPQVYGPEDKQTYEFFSSLKNEKDKRHFKTNYKEIFGEHKFVSKVAIPVDEKLRDSFKSINLVQKNGNSGTPNIVPPYILYWFKMDEDLSNTTQQLSFLFLGIFSDFWLDDTNAFPYMNGYNEDKIEITMTVSLDHSLWFHRPFRVDDWILFELDSPRLASGRGFLSGRYYSKDGTLLASMTQENLFRTRVLADDAITKFKFIKPPIQNDRSLDKTNLKSKF
ncbi:hypothetical protein BB558_001711 [Smittium angustum]|uniref:Acyl-CoA thioesterase II n=2 Tax=Harpellales TaxID=61421 RepID=A0A2U1JAW3_SMIAN|nr:hypothetical protein BB558_001711 [Smittium angustum]